MPPLRAGIIGLGVGEQHIAGYERHPQCRVTALCDHAPAVLAAVLQRHPHLRGYTDADALLRDPTIDVVSIASYDDAHAEQVLLALAHGKHVFVEKPLCLLPADAVAIRRALVANPTLQLSSNLILRHSPRFVALREQLQAGTLGTLFYAEADYDYGRLHKLTDGWRGRLPDYSVMLGGGVHMVDLLLWLTGGTVREVAAFGNRLASGERIACPNDLVAGLLSFDGGLVAKVSANFGSVRPHFHRLSLYGTAATFVNGPADAQLYTSRDPAVPPTPVTTEYPGVHKGGMLASFVGSILGEGPADVPADDVFRVLSVCFALDEAAAAHRTVSVSYL